jgi:hemolysin III
MRSQEEEIVNAYTHLVWSIISILAIFIPLFSEKYDFYDKVGLLIMAGLSAWAFFCSFLYHVSQHGKYKKRNRIVDKAAIYLMIIGCGVSLNMTNPNEMIAMIVPVLICILGSLFIAYMCISKNTSESFSVFTYVMLSWVSAIPATGLLGETIYITTSTLWAIITGGIFYSIGVVFYSKDKLKWNHTWWHLCVMIGYIFHLYAQLKALYIL